MFICCICHKSLDAPFKCQQLSSLEDSQDNSADDSSDESSSGGEDDDDEQVQILLNHGRRNNSESSQSNEPGLIGNPLSNQIHSDDNHTNRARTRIRRTAEINRISDRKWRDLDKNFRDKTLYRTTNYSQAISTPCGHLFHFGCLFTWLKHLERKGCKTTCAYCRQLIRNPLDLTPVFPLLKDHNSDSDSNSSSTNSQAVDIQAQKLVKTTEDGSCQKIKEARKLSLSTCSSGHFWLSVILVVLSLCLHNEQVRSAVENWKEDEDEDAEAEFIPFGTCWTLLVFFCTTASLIFDSAEFSHPSSSH